MKKILLLLMVTSLSFANDATMLNARYDYILCDVDYAKAWLEMRESCAEREAVPVFDSSAYTQKCDELLTELKAAAGRGQKSTFSIIALQIKASSLNLIGEVFKDAFDEKTPEFFSCVRDGENPLKVAGDGCRQKALENEKYAAKSYINSEIADAEHEIGRLNSKGIDTSGMQEIADHGKDLVFDIDYAYGVLDPAEVRKIHLRHSRLVFLFRAEQVFATLNYAEPLIEKGNNRNREEALGRIQLLKSVADSLVQECEYSSTVENNANYARLNTKCWEEGLDAYKEFNEIGKLISKGV
ncbi:hypothetical protein JXA56_02900 [Candidatus Micrarchaeota archaeon]|nr:hypothetical protein [Candidatus Micrarchaeota archaeon]